MTKSLRFLQKAFLFDAFNKWRINHKTVIIHQIMMNHVAFSSVNITDDVKILNFLANHIVITHNQRLVIGENRNQTNNNQNKAKSINAVIFANAANPKNNHAIITYFNISFLSFDFLF